ncbi:arginase family protein [Olivibacter sp. CPCC 100613]|uniref:arginase family protein n=1 Tax=Olivibacter sp. CPCC 100613 TaxID=3079931 RepID=UPI002FF5B608
MKNIYLIECPSNLGLKEPRPGQEPGVNKLPDWLRRWGLYDYFPNKQIVRLDAPSYTMDLDVKSGVRNADALVNYAIKQKRFFEQEIDESVFPFIVGGDCSVLLGPLLSLAERGNQALFYLDGHTDFIWPSLSQTGGAGGMAAAFAAGRGPEKISNILGLKPYIKEEHVWCVGNREYVDWYEQVIIDSEATYIPLNRLRSMGIKSCIDSFFYHIENKKVSGFWIHFDVDVLNDELMPAVDSRSPDGLLYQELRDLLLPLLGNSKVTGMSMSILDPDLDPDGFYTERFVIQLGQIFKEVFKQIR